MLDFNKIVKILFKKSWNIVFKEDIFEIIDPEKKPKYQSKVDKTIYSMKAKWLILPIKSWVYIIPDDKDKTLNKIDLIDKYYLKLSKKYIIFYVWSEYYISWKKALEIHLKNYSIPEKIFIVNRKLNKKVIVWNYEIIFKTISWNFEWKKINLFSKFFTYTEYKTIDNTEFKISNIELSLIESCILSDINESSIDISLLKKVLKKYAITFNSSIFYEIAKYKYIMSFNRLKELSRWIDKQLYMIFLDIIKRNWGLFIGEGLRGF
jgi:hypothetical protein